MAILMSTHNICFYGEITKIIPKLSLNTLLICSNVSCIFIYNTDKWIDMAKWSATNKSKPTKWSVHPAKIQISLGIRPVWSESSYALNG